MGLSLFVGLYGGGGLESYKSVKRRKLGWYVWRRARWKEIRVLREGCLDPLFLLCPYLGTHPCLVCLCVRVCVCADSEIDVQYMAWYQEIGK